MTDLTAEQFHDFHLAQIAKLGGNVTRDFISERTNKSEMQSFVQYTLDGHYFCSSLRDFGPVANFVKGGKVNP